MQRLLSRPARVASSALLTIGAVLGTLCLVATVAFPLLDVRPLIFLSGSMSPAIPAGSLALAHEVGAEDIEIGDVVTVPVNDTFVTHRVVDATHRPGSVTMLLQGDGNKVVDDEIHTVASVPRTEIWIPHAGTVVVWFSHAPGVYLLAGWVALVLGTVRRQRRGPGPSSPPRAGSGGPKLLLALRRRLAARGGGRVRLGPRVARAGGIVATVIAVAVVAPLAAPSPAMAAWAYTTTVTGTHVRAVTIAPSVVTCTDLGSTVRLSWTAVTGATQYWISHGGLGADRVVNETVQASEPLFRDFDSTREGRFDVYVRFGSDQWLSNRSNQVSYTKGNCG